MSTVIAEPAELPSCLQNLSAPAPADGASSRLVFRAAEKSAEFADHLRAHYRETRRTSAEIPCEIKIVLADGSAFDSGSATVRNVSPSGALLGGLKLSRGCYPAASFKLLLSLNGAQYKGICIEATPVRLAPDVGGLGVKFDEIFVTV